MAFPMDVHMAFAWSTPGVAHSVIPMVPHSGRGGFCLRVYHSNPELLDFHFCVSFVLRIGLFLFLVKI